ncbi:MAG TPA: phosphoenolpyruvate--protein phosphotransferase [Egibacteraceae bacterium]|nr:phosphoenolpyruvate--protein phosphotransferase [Egibacteraceae bacterium]
MTAALLHGRGASPGVAVAPAFVMAPRPRPEARSDAAPVDPAHEHERLDRALAQAIGQLEAVADRLSDAVGAEEAAIFTAHAAFAADPELAGMAHGSIDAGATAEDAVRDAFGAFRNLLSASADEYLAARAADLDDVAERVVGVLTGATRPVPTERCIVVAHDLAPSDTAELPRDLVAGVVCEAGSPTSHAAILARSLGIPAVVGARDVITRAPAGVVLAVDGRSGEVLVDPDEVDRDRYAKFAAAEAERRERLEALRDLPGQTADGVHVELAANVNDPGALDRALGAGAQGSGLVRTEFLFLDATDAPTVDDQVAYYRRVLDAFPGERVVFRTLDIGADKPVPFITRPPEENPALGVRGLRLGLAEPRLLRDQLRALLRAASPAGGPTATGRLAIMFPMVATTAEVDEARAILDEVAGEEGVDVAGVEVGVMVEVPAAALAADRLARRVDFLSIGTNDLLQYLFAADRLNPDVAGIPDVFDPDVLRLIGSVCRAAAAHGAWVGVCGEAAAEPRAAAAFVALGVTELSMTPNAVPDVKDKLRRHTGDELRAAADAALAAPDGTAARAAFKEALR